MVSNGTNHFKNRIAKIALMNRPIDLMPADISPD